MFKTNLGDLYAFVCFLVCWVGYTGFADYARRDSRSIMVAMHDLRVLWMSRMLRRDVRIGDVNILGVANRSVMLLVTTTVFILAGLVAIMGSLGVKGHPPRSPPPTLSGKLGCPLATPSLWCQTVPSCECLSTAFPAFEELV